MKLTQFLKTLQIICLFKNSLYNIFQEYKIANKYDLFFHSLVYITNFYVKTYLRILDN